MPELAAELRQRFTRHPDYAARWAQLPIGSTPLRNPHGGAPGFRIENVWVLPGLPSEMEAMFDAYAEKLRGDRPISSWRRGFRTRESDIVHLLTGATVRWPQVSIGSYPRFMPDGPEVEIVLKSADAKALAQAVVVARARARHGHGGAGRGVRATATRRATHAGFGGCGCTSPAPPTAHRARRRWSPPTAPSARSRSRCLPRSARRRRNDRLRQGLRRPRVRRRGPAHSARPSLRPPRKTEPQTGPHLAPIRQRIESVFCDLQRPPHTRTPRRTHPTQPLRPRRDPPARARRLHQPQPPTRPTQPRNRRPTPPNAVA